MNFDTFQFLEVLSLSGLLAVGIVIAAWMRNDNDTP